MYPNDHMSFNFDDKPHVPKIFIVILVILLLLLSVAAGIGAAAFLEQRQANTNSNNLGQAQESFTSETSTSSESESLSTEILQSSENTVISKENTAASTETSESTVPETQESNTNTSETNNPPDEAMEENTIVIDGHRFSAVDEKVTAKEATNLRNVPSQGENSQVIITLLNGQIATRTAVSDHGWSQVVYEGETYYAVSSLLTTDLSVKAPEPTQAPVTDNDIKTEFVACDEIVSAKIEVNLRNIPSTTSENSYVVASIKYGEKIKRTGYNEDHGWSRVEYNGQILYCVSSYIYVIEEPDEEQ